MRCRLSPKLCFSIPVEKIMMATLEDVWQPETGPPIMIDKENGWLKYTALDVTVNIDFISRGPAALGYDGASSCLYTIVPKLLAMVTAHKAHFAWRTIPPSSIICDGVAGSLVS